jgi:hypothetical protein
MDEIAALQHRVVGDDHNIIGLQLNTRSLWFYVYQLVEEIDNLQRRCYALEQKLGIELDYETTPFHHLHRATENDYRRLSR